MNNLKIIFTSNLFVNFDIGGVVNPLAPGEASFFSSTSDTSRLFFFYSFFLFSSSFFLFSSSFFLYFSSFFRCSSSFFSLFFSASFIFFYYFFLSFSIFSSKTLNLNSPFFSLAGNNNPANQISKILKENVTR